jgi:hypothetical protein
MANAEYKFPDEVADDKDAIEVEIDGESDIDLEVVDDTPEKDRNRKPLEREPDEVTDEEVAQYSDKVQKRIKELSHARHDERRAKESAEREKQEALRVAQALLEENRKLRTGLTTNQSVTAELVKSGVEKELVEVRRAYKEAQESMDPDEILKAQEALTDVKIRMQQVVNAAAMRQRNEEESALQAKEQQVYNEATPQAAQPDPKANAWQRANPWFGQDDEMTAFALGVHRKLVNGGLDPRADEYYERLNARLRQVYPEQFGEKRADTKPATVVAPATRSSGPRKVRLSKTQEALAKRLGVPLEEYARQLVKQESSNV